MCASLAELKVHNVQTCVKLHWLFLICWWLSRAEWWLPWMCT